MKGEEAGQGGGVVKGACGDDDAGVLGSRVATSVHNQNPPVLMLSSCGHPCLQLSHIRQHVDCLCQYVLPLHPLLAAPRTPPALLRSRSWWPPWPAWQQQGPKGSPPPCHP